MARTTVHDETSFDIAPTDTIDEQAEVIASATKSAVKKVLTAAFKIGFPVPGTLEVSSSETDRTFGGDVSYVLDAAVEVELNK